MTRAEVDRIKARLLDQIFEEMGESYSPTEVCDFVEMQMHVVEVLEEAMQLQNEELKENGYQ